MEVLRFGVSLEDSVSDAAGVAGKSLRTLQVELDKGAAATQRMGLAQSKALAMNAAYDLKIDKATQALGRMQSAALAMNAAHDAAGKHAEGHGLALLKVVEPAEVMRHALESVSGGLREMGSAIKSGDAKGAVSGLAESLGGLASTLDLVVPGLGQVASAAIKAGGAFAAMTVGVVQGGVEMALEVTAVNDKLEAVFQALGKGPDAGKATLEMLNSMSAKLPQSRAQLAEWTQQFQAMGITDLGQLRMQIQATASAQAIAGSAGASSYEALTRKIQGAIDANGGLLKVDRRLVNTLHELGAGSMLVGGKALIKGMTVDAQAFGNALSESLATKGKGPLEAMGSEMATLKVKASETFAHFFDGIDTHPLTDAFLSVIHLGDLGEPSGAALSHGIKGGLTEVIRGLGELVTEGEIAFLTLELWTIQYGPTARGVIRGIETGVRGLVVVVETLLSPLTAVLDLATAIKATLTGGVGVSTGGQAGIAGLALGRGGSRGATGWGGGEEPRTGLAPAHASGGLVMRPAAGEYMASVAPGEMILPAQAARQMSRSALGGGAQAAEASPGGGGGGVHVERLTVTVQAAAGVTDAQALSVVGLTAALERLALMGGR